MTIRGRPKVEWIKAQCAWCGTELGRRASDMARNLTGRVFCSMECRNKVGSKPRRKSEVTCQQCGKVFYPETGRVNKFCSKACHDQSQRKDRVLGTCEICGKSFEMKPSQARNWTGRFCSIICEKASRIQHAIPGRSHNGRPAILNTQGYVRVYEPSHPKAGTGGWILEHRLVVEKAIGRMLEAHEHVHHINGIKTDNRPENLQLMGSRDHAALTNAETQERIQRDRAELERYRRLYGPLPPEED